MLTVTRSGFVGMVRYAGIFAGVLALFSLAGCGAETKAVKPQAADNDYHILARTVFDETNRLRREPGAYVKILKSMVSRMDGKVYLPENSNVGIVTREGAGAVREAISVLQGQSPLSTLIWSDELAALARAHVDDTGVKGLIGHESSNGRDFPERVETLAQKRRFTFTAENIAYGPDSGREVVAQLFVDDGVPSRGHRTNILTKKLKYSGVACGYHRKYRHMCVAIYANG